MNIASNLDHAAYHFPDHCAVIEGDRSVSFSEFCRDASQMASAMVEFGIQPGDHVALCAPNSYAWVVFYFGAANGVDVHSRKEEECKSANLEAVTWKFRLSGSAAWE